MDKNNGHTIEIFFKLFRFEVLENLLAQCDELLLAIIIVFCQDQGVMFIFALSINITSTKTIIRMFELLQLHNCCNITQTGNHFKRNCSNGFAFSMSKCLFVDTVILFLPKLLWRVVLPAFPIHAYFPEEGTDIPLW